MSYSIPSIGRFFKVIGSRQAYRNLIYLLASFPLGIFYFVFLVTGFSTGISLSIIWIGIPILLLVTFGGWVLAKFEHFMAVDWLKEDIPTMSLSSNESSDIKNRFREILINPITWKSLFYLFFKFPLGIATFIILTTFISITVAFLSMPFTYEFIPSMQAGIFTSQGLPVWTIDSMMDAILVALIGLILWPVTLHVTNGLAWVHAKFARIMLSLDPMGGFVRTFHKA
jgi:hypothetical protein